MKSIIQHINEAISSQDKKNAIGQPLYYFFKLFGNSTRANEITFDIEGEKFYIHRHQRDIMFITKNKDDIDNTFSLHEYRYQVSKIMISGDSEFDKKQYENTYMITDLYGLDDDDKILWISDIKRNTIYVNYTTNGERIKSLRQ